MTQAAWLFCHRSESSWTETCLLCAKHCPWLPGRLGGCEPGWLGEVLAGGVGAVTWVRFLGSLAWLLLFSSLKRASFWACQLDQSRRPGRHAPRGGRFRLEKAQSNCKSQPIDNLSGWGCHVSYRGYAAGSSQASPFSSACLLHSALPSWPSLCLSLWCLPSRYSWCFLKDEFHRWHSTSRGSEWATCQYPGSDSASTSASCVPVSKWLHLSVLLFHPMKERTMYLWL